MSSGCPSWPAPATTRWRLRVARGRLLPLALSLERYPYTDRDSEPRWLATCYAKIARRCPRVRRCSVAFGHMRGVLGDGAGTNSNNGCACPWTADLEYLHVAGIPFPAAVDLRLAPLPPAPGLRHLTLVWTRPSGPARTLHLLTPAHLAGYAMLEHLDLFGLRIDEAAMRAVLLALKPTLKGLKACSVTVFAAGHVAPAEWLDASLGDSLVFRELYMCTRRRLWAHTRPLCALQGVRYLTLDLQHLPRYYQREFYPPNVKSVCFVAGSSSRSTANLFPPCVFARYAWRLIARDRDAGCVLQLQTVTIAVPSCCAEETRMWVLLSFLLTAAAQARGLEFKLNLYIMYVSGGDTFRWEPPPRPSAKERVKTVLNRLLGPKV